jgi:hypothetical protein
MGEGMQFVARWLAGAPMAELCGEFNISRESRLSHERLPRRSSPSVRLRRSRSSSGRSS